MTQLILEQALNGLQFGLMLFLIAAGLTLVFGIMDMIHLSHGSLYMGGAYLGAAAAQASGSFLVGLSAAVLGMAVIGVLLETAVLRHFYRRDHLAQVLATFALILISNDLVRMIWGPQPLLLNPPEALAGPIELFGFSYPAYRLLIIAVGLGIALALYWLIGHTRAGMWVRAGAANRAMAEALGVDVRRLFTGLFALGAALAALAGVLLGPLLAVQVGMGENILILAFVVIVIGGIGSIRGALVGSLLVGIVDTLGRALLPTLLRAVAPADVASQLGPALASIAIYLLMAGVLFWRPAGLFPARA
ncbi:MAG: branched-chain amino acid ABC transporter permease [Rhodocyclaceae bacterium]|nr:branched-chain amino acid ABC transporter permease [Rhodocyclaceae bacterium]